MSFGLFGFHMRKLFLQRYIVAQCGHRTPIYGYLKAYGTTRVAWLHDKEGAPYCFASIASTGRQSHVPGAVG